MTAGLELVGGIDGRRLREVLEASGKNAVWLCRTVGISRSSAYGYLKGGAEVGRNARVVFGILEALGLTLERAVEISLVAVGPGGAGKGE